MTADLFWLAFACLVLSLSVVTLGVAIALAYILIDATKRALADLREGRR